MYTIKQYEALTAAIAQGVRSVYYGDKRIDFRSQDEMLKLRDEMEIELGLRKNIGKQILASFSKGLK